MADTADTADTAERTVPEAVRRRAAELSGQYGLGEWLDAVVPESDDDGETYRTVVVVLAELAGTPDALAKFADDVTPEARAALLDALRRQEPVRIPAEGSVDEVVRAAHRSALTSDETAALLAALDAVPCLDLYAYHPDRDGGDGEPQTWRDHSDEGWGHANRELERAEQLKAERDRYRDGLNAAIGGLAADDDVLTATFNRVQRAANAALRKGETADGPPLPG